MAASLVACGAAAHVGFEQRAGELRAKLGGGEERGVQGETGRAKTN